MQLLDLAVDGFACAAAAYAAISAWRARAEASNLRAELTAAHERHRADRANACYRGSVLGSIVHEIGTPVNAIVGMADAILAGPLDESQREAASIAQRHARILFGVIGELLDYTKLDLGMLELDRSYFAPRTMLSDIVSMLQPSATAKGRTISARCDDDVPAALGGDAGRLGRTLVRIATHLIDAGDCGSVMISASLERREGNAVHVRFSVADDRNPFDLPSLERSFEQRGARFGLEICRRVVAHMDGAFQVVRTAGRGSSVRFVLPLEAVEARESAPGAACRILVVDDDPINRRVLADQLRGFDITVDNADDGTSALEAFMVRDYDLVFMDLNMPRMDGLTATRSIRERESGVGRHTTIVALTASTTIDTHDACLAAGMDDVLTKPLGRRRLEETLARWLGRAVAA